MKRDVKVGLSVAALVCCLAAVLLGGGLTARTPGSIPKLDLGGVASGTAAWDESSASVPSDLSEIIAAPEELGDEAFTAPDEASDEFAAPADGYETFNFGETLGAGDVVTDVVTNDALAESYGASAETFGPDAPFHPAGPVSETPADVYAAGISAGDGPMPGPEDVEFGGGASLVPAVAVEDAGAPEDAVSPKRFYIIEEGESFWTVSKKLYKSVRHYAAIIKANPDVNPKRVRAGQVIAVPVIDGADLQEDLLATAEELEPKSRRPRVYLARDVEHVIRSGETLGDIAQKYYKSAIKWPHILVANPDLDPKRLRARKTIIVPALTEAPGAPKLPDTPRPRRVRAPRPPKVYLARETQYVVEPGDTLEHISKRHYDVRHKWQHILKDPRNAGVDARRLRPGDKIIIPALTE
jgi:nucleoid-associated protein YgaU